MAVTEGLQFLPELSRLQWGRHGFSSAKAASRGLTLGGPGSGAAWWAALTLPCTRRVREAAPVLRVPGEVFLWLLPLLQRVLHPCADPEELGLQEVLRQQFLQAAAGWHMAPAHCQFAEHQPQRVCQGQGAGPSEGEQPPTGTARLGLKRAHECPRGWLTVKWVELRLQSPLPTQALSKAPLPNFFYLHIVLHLYIAFTVYLLLFLKIK